MKMKVSKFLYAALIAGLSFLASAADLTFDLKINRGAEVDCNPQVKKQTVAIFVIDCSGSMMFNEYVDQETGKKYYGPSGTGKKAWNRAQLVAEKLLPELFETLPAGTQAYAYLYTMQWDPMITEMTAVFSSPEEKAKFLNALKKGIYTRVEKNGATPYYDTMELVLTKIKKTDWLANPNVNLMLFDYTDGLNATGYVRGFRYPSNHGKKEPIYKAELEAAKERFNSKWGNFLKRIAQKGFYEQLNVGTKAENPEVKHIPAYKVALTCDQSALKNPQDAPSQRVPLYAAFPVNQESWNLLRQKDQCKVSIKFGNGSFKSYPVSLKNSANQIKVSVPNDALNKPTLVTVSFDCSKGVPGKFTLFPPKPIQFYLPGPRPTIEQLMLQGSVFDGKTVMTVLKGKKVFLSADGSAKNYIWKFSDGKELKGKSVSRIFDKVGTYKFEVFTEGNLNSRKSGSIEVVAIDLLIVPQGGKFTEPRKDTEFKAAVPAGNLKPSSCIWYVTGPIDPNAKENPAVTRLVDGSDPLHNRFTFAKPGEYRINVTAKYDRLPLETREAHTPWNVYEPAEIAFSKSMEGEGHVFEFGQTVKLSIDTSTGKIDEKSIVWKENGQVIGRGSRKVDHISKIRSKGQVVYRVEVKDPVMNKVRILKRIYAFDCSHAEPVHVMLTKDGKQVIEIGQGDTVYFRIKSADRYEKIRWSFAGMEKQAPNGEPVPYVAEKAGKIPVVLNCSCKKCHTPFTKNFDIKIQSNDPKPRLTFTPDESFYKKDEKVTLSDDGTGYYQNCRLMWKLKDDKEFKVYKTLKRKFKEEIILVSQKTDNKNNNELLVPHWRTDFVFKIEALDKNGKKVAESAPRTILIRDHITALAILGGVIAFITVIFILLSKILRGNGPRAWKIYYLSNNQKPVQENYLQEYKNTVASCQSKLLKPYWKIGRRIAVIELKKLGFDGPYPASKLTVYPSRKKDPLHIEEPGIPQEDKLHESPIEYAAFYEIRPIGCDDDDDERIRYLRLCLNKKKMDISGDVAFWILLILALSAWIVASVWLLAY